MFRIRWSAWPGGVCGALHARLCAVVVHSNAVVPVAFHAPTRGTHSPCAHVRDAAQAAVHEARVADAAAHPGATAHGARVLLWGKGRVGQSQGM